MRLDAEDIMLLIILTLVFGICWFAIGWAVT